MTHMTLHGTFFKVGDNISIHVNPIPVTDVDWYRGVVTHIGVVGVSITDDTGDAVFFSWSQVCRVYD